ncbi:hypothetical protein ACSBR2_019564 [Camellia fascicularis]
MAISKALISSMVLSLLVLDLVQAVQTNQELVQLGADCHQGQGYARGHVGLAVVGANVFLPAPQATLIPVLATPP